MIETQNYEMHNYIVCNTVVKKNLRSTTRRMRDW